MKYTLTLGITQEATQRVMVAKLTRLTHKIAIQVHLVAESCTICSSHSRQPVWKLLDTHLYDIDYIFKFHFDILSQVNVKVQLSLC
jgi:arginine/ornithine N-succinyltransferase beta subunit